MSDKPSEVTRNAVNVDKSVHEIYKTLTDSAADVEQAPFRTMKDVFMWALALGHARGERRPLKSKEMIFRWEQFTAQVDVPLLKAVAIAANGEVGVLASQSEVLSIAEEYANAGIHELRTRLLEDGGRPLWNLVAIAEEQWITIDSIGPDK